MNLTCFCICFFSAFSSLCQNVWIQNVNGFWCEEKPIELRAFGDTSYAWANANDPDSILSTDFILHDQTDTPPTYLLYTSTDTITYSIQNGKQMCFCQYYVPNVFTPNGDLFNEYFKPIINCNAFAMRLTIYSREQLIVFDETDYEVKWNGKNAQGQLMQAGMYAYILSFIDEEGEKYTVEGFVILHN